MASSSDINNRVSISNSDVGNVNVNIHNESKGFDFLHVGIIGILIDVVCYIVGSSKQKKEEKYFKQKTYNPERGTYYDSKCVERLYSDDSIVYRRRNVYGEMEIEYQNGVKRNLAQEKYNAQPGTVTRLAGYKCYNKDHFFITAIGHRYEDRATQKVYVIRNLKYNNKQFLFYMDVETGLLIRPTDGQLEIEKEAKKQNKEYFTNDYFKKMIEYFNNKRNTSRIEWLYRNGENDTEYSPENIKNIVKHRKENV